MSKHKKMITITVPLIAALAVFLLIHYYNTGTGAALSKKVTHFRYHTSNYIKLCRYEDELWDYKENPDKVSIETVNEKCLEIQAFINEITESNFTMLSLYDDFSPITDIVSLVKDNEYTQIENTADEMIKIIGKTNKTLTNNNSSYQGSVEIINQCMSDLNLAHSSYKLNERLKKAISDAEKTIEDDMN